jgi:hypothetical protein
MYNSMHLRDMLYDDLIIMPKYKKKDYEIVMDVVKFPGNIMKILSTNPNIYIDCKYSCKCAHDIDCLTTE